MKTLDHRVWEFEHVEELVGGVPREGVDALQPSQFLALCITSTLLFLSCSLYNNLVTVNCFPECCELV